MSAWLNYLNQAMDRAQQRRGREQFGQLLGQAPTVETQAMMGPLQPGQARPQVTAPVAGTGAGLLGGQMTMPEFYAKAATIPGYEKFGMEGLLGGKGIKPTGIMQNLEAAGYIPGTPEYQKAMLDYLMKAQTQVNIGDTKPLGADAKNWTNAQGQKAPATMTITEATASGFTPKTTEELKTTLGAEQAAAPMANMLQYGFGKGKEGSLFPPASAGLLERGKGAAESWLKGKTDSDLRISLYNKNKSALVTGLARLVGQVGTLTDRDVDTVAGLFPTVGLTPEPVAKEQFKTIATLLAGKGVPREKLQAMGFPSWALGDQGSAATPQTEADYNALPSGALFIDPDDGETYRKP